MDVDPLSIFFAIVRIAAFVVVIIFFAYLYTVTSVQLKTADLERYNIELAQAMMSSELTSSKHVFDAAKMNNLNGKEIPPIRSCGYAYKIIVEDLKTKEEWKFGTEPENRFKNIYNTIQNRFGVSIAVPNEEKPANFYGTVNPGRMTLIVYDHLTGRMACAIEKAFILKEAQNLTIENCISLYSFGDPLSCFGFRKTEKGACVFHRRASSEDLDCKSFPSEIKFEEIYETGDSLREKGANPSKPMNILAYPLKAEASCADVKESPEAYVAGNDDDVITVLLCMENLK